ncbi:MAG: hypothetical protein Q4B54_06355 [Coriobacteriales bacterium]|nr:hypothetical protein [Coriobacteriales bacterium]
MGTVKEALRELGLDYLKFDKPILEPGFAMWDETCAPKTSPREIYRSKVLLPALLADDVRPGDGVHDTVSLPPLRDELAREVAFMVLHDLEAQCILVASDSRWRDVVSVCNPGDKYSGVGGIKTRDDLSETDRQLALLEAQQTAVLAAQLFDGMVEPSMLNDWGLGRATEPVFAKFYVSASLLRTLKWVFRYALDDLRLLLAKERNNYEQIADDVWHTNSALFVIPEASRYDYSPIWWMLPTHHVTGLYDPLAIRAERIFQPFEPTQKILDEPRRDRSLTEFGLTLSETRGLAAICGMILARSAFSPNDTYADVRHDVDILLFDLVELASLHKRLLSACRLL